MGMKRTWRASFVLGAMLLGCGGQEQDIAEGEDDGLVGRDEQAIEAVDPGETLLVGTATVQTTAVTQNAGTVNAHPVAAVASGTVSKLKVYVDATNTATTIRLGLYAQASSAPAALVASCSITSVTNGAWNACTVTGSPSVTSGATYYVAPLAPSGGSGVALRRSSGSSTAHYKTGQSTLPSPFGTSSGTFTAGTLSFAAVEATTTSTTVTLNPVADAEVKANASTTNYGSATSVTSDYVDSSIGGQANFYLKFDVAGLPAGSTITSAKLRCYVTNFAGASAWPSVYLTGTSWIETGAGSITWTNQPATTGSALGVFPGGTANAYAELDVTSALTGNGTYSFGFIPAALDDGMTCNSREAASNKPELVIQYSAGSTPTALSCPTGYTEVFRDDFEGTSVDTTKWNIANQNVGGGTFTQLTHMLSANVAVSGGTLKIASKRHCSAPYPTITAENPGQCAGTNYYSGGWITGKSGHAPGKGLMIFRAKMPSAVRGYFPALWARNAHGWETNTYGELDLIEKWWDMGSKGTDSNDDLMASTTHIYNGTTTSHTTSNTAGPYAGSSIGFHVWEVEWNATVTPATIKYYYRDSPTSTRNLLRTVTYSSTWNAALTDQQVKDALNDTGCSTNCGFRPYIDFAVQPDSAYHVSPDTATTYDPTDLEVDSVITCDG